jgi:hypothetical protein
MNIPDILATIATSGGTALLAAGVAIFATGRQRTRENVTDDRTTDSKIASTITTNAVLEERITNLQNSIPVSIKAAVTESRMILSDSLRNGLGESINRPVVEKIDALNNRLTHALEIQVPQIVRHEVRNVLNGALMKESLKDLLGGLDK